LTVSQQWAASVFELKFLRSKSGEQRPVGMHGMLSPSARDETFQPPKLLKKEGLAVVRLAMSPSLLDHARRYSSSGSLSMNAVQSPDLASRYDSRMLNDRAERGRKAKEHDRHWAAGLANLEAHKQRMSVQHLRVVSGRHQQETQRLRTAQSLEAINSNTERTVLLNALRLQQEADEERATTASEESAEQRRRRYREHREYLARLRQDTHDREQAALRAIAAKEEACRLAQERQTQPLPQA